MMIAICKERGCGSAVWILKNIINNHSLENIQALAQLMLNMQPIRGIWGET
jgi:hypothetical protein